MKNNEILICDCESTEHQIVLHEDEKDKVIYCHIHLIKYGFIKRLIKGIKYIFGYKCKYGEWDEFILSNKHVNDLKEIIKFLENDK
jgi:hypothetical protein